MTAFHEQSGNTRNGDAGDAPARDSGSRETDAKAQNSRPAEYGGRGDGLDPVRYGDWEKNGRCIDF